ncbi:MAG: fibronectin type III domain-containing protein, partial [Nonlabens sp.]|uniref:fibronectin type III domain-containing protein n=2 Tax=Nonlabens sp. TaxID=1888209 RepID=UPI00321A9931
MKTKLLLIVAFLVSSLSIAQCDYTLELTDNFGNEWDSGDNLAANAGVDVSINGVVTTYLVLNSSPNTPATTVVENYTITVNDGDAIEIDYRATFFPGDAGFRLLDSEGIEVYASPINQASAMDLFVGTATCPTCFAVTTLTTNNITATGADIGWTATGTESAWEVEYGPVGFTPGTGITDNATSNPWTIDGLMSETAYDVYVRADCGMGDISSNQGPINFTTTESCPAPTNFASQDETASEIQFIWDDNGNSSTNYEVNYGVAPFNQGDAGGQTVQGFFGTFAQITGLTSNTEYSFYVRYDCGMSDFSSWSGPYTASTLQSCPDIENIVFSNIDQTSVDIAWDNGGTETEWEIEYGPAPLTAGTGTTVIANTNPFTLTGLMSGTSYDICVTAVCAPTDRSTPVCAEVLTPADYCNGDQLVDSGGPTGNYSANELVTYTVCPDNTGDVVYVEFLEFILEDSFAGCWDDLTIYDGPDTNSPIILTPGGDEGWCWDVTSGTGDLTGETLIGKLPSGCLTFVFDSDGSGQRAGFIADVTCAAPPACPTPFDVVVDGSTATTVDLSWEAGGTETEWDIEYGATGFLPGDGTVVNAMTNPFSVPGLTQNTTYDFYITAVCGSGDESSVVGPISGITQCDAETTPYSEDFEVGFTPTTSGFPGAADAFVSENCYSTDNSNYAWVLAPGTLTASGGTGPAPSVTTGNYFYAEGSNGTENDIADLITPLFDSSSLTIPSVGFDYHMAGVDIGSLEVIVRASGVDTVVGTITGTQQVLDTDPYVSLNIALNAFAGETFQIIFRATRGADFASDIAIDNVTIAEAPTCSSPLGLTLDASTATTLDLSWTNGGTETAWEIEYVDAGEAQGTGTIVAAATNPFTVTGLTSNTSYDLYLRSVCAAGDESVWIGPLSVTTDAACGDTVYDTGGPTGNYSNNETYTITYLPENVGDVVTLNFTLVDLEECCDTLEVFDGLDVNATLLEGDLESPALFRATNLDGAITIRFDSDGSVNEAGWVANYTCEAPPTCFEVTDIDVTNVTTTTADIAWTSNGTEMLWDVEFVEQGNTPTGTPTESATTNPYTTSSLSSGTSYEV